MKVEKNGNNLVVTIPIDSNFPLSASGKTRRVYSSEGNKPTGLYLDTPQGKREVTAGMNFYYKP